MAPADIAMYDNVMDLPLVGMLDLPVGWHVASHRHPRPELILVTRGQLSADIGGRRIAAGAGDAFVHPAGVPHHERNDGRGPLGLIFLLAEFEPLPGVLHDASGRLRLLLRWLAEDQGAGAPAAVQAGWLAAIRAQLPGCRSAGDAVVAGVRARLRRELRRTHALEALAGAAGIGPRQLLRRYRAATGTTPLADLRRMRCDAAAELLVTTDLPLAAIAAETGFCDAFHLSKAFRRRHGMPPAAMRAR